MAQADNANSYPDARGFMDRALEQPKGYRAIFKTRAAAISFRFRCYTARTKELKRNTKIYDKDSQMHNNSVYHALILLLKDYPDGSCAVEAVHDESAAMEAIDCTFEPME